MSKYEVKLVEPEDFDWCVQVAAVRMIKEELRRPELVDIPTLYLLVNKMYEDKTAIIVKVEGEYAGGIGGYLHPNILNPDIATLAEMIWYVLPEYRNSRVGALLIKAYDEMAKNSPAHEATLSLLNASPVNYASLEKRGFNVEEQAFRKVYKEM